MESIVALDIGTAFCSAAVFRKGKAEILPIEGKSRCPSFVLCREGLSFNGLSAKEHWKQYPTETIYSSFRLLGCFGNHPWHTNSFSSAPFKIDPKGERVNIVAGEGPLAVVTSPEEVCSRLIGHVMKEIEEKPKIRGEERKPVVLCVPTCTSFAKRQALKSVAEANGLKVLRFVNSTTAAALKHCIDRDLFHKEERTIVVLDMGAGNTTVSVVTVEGCKMKVEASSGTDTFGGDFIDEKIYDSVAEKLKYSHGIHISTLPTAAVELRSSIKLCKHISSHHMETNVGIQPKPGVFFTENVNQEILRDLCGDHVERTLISHFKNVIVAVKIQPRKVDEVLLIGGSSNIPLVRSVIKKTFPQAEISCDYPTWKEKTAETMAVSGAALHASLFSVQPSEEMKNIEIEETVNFNLGYEMPGGSLRNVFEVDSPLPADNEFFLSKIQLEKSSLVNIYEGVGFYQGANFLAAFNVAALIRQEDVLSNHLIKLKFEMDEKGVFLVTAYHLSSGQFLRFNIVDAKQNETTRFLKSLKETGDQKKTRRQTLDKASKLVQNLKRKASEYKLEMHVGNEDRMKIEQASSEFEAWLIANPDADLDVVERRRQALENVCGGVVMQRIKTKKRLL